MFNHFFKHEIFLRVLNITAEESRRDTLLSASCQELFEYMRKVCGRDTRCIATRRSLPSSTSSQENMKEAINHCMTVYGGKVRALAENPLLGPRFQNFIRRWEMNNASPPPEEEKKAESYVHCLVSHWLSAVDEPVAQSQMVRGGGDRAVSPRQKKRTTSTPTTTKRCYPSYLRLRPTREAI